MTRPADWTRGTPRIVLTACDACRNRWYLPCERCPVCGSTELSPFEAAGSGLCVAVTRLHVTAADEPEPAVGLALVELDEGPLAMGRASDDLVPGERASVSFAAADGGGPILPTFSREVPARG